MDNVLMFYLIPAIFGVVVSNVFSFLGREDSEFVKEMRTAQNLSFLPVINFLIIVVLLGILIRLILDFIKQKIR
jgi:hypothetical protein